MVCPHEYKKGDFILIVELLHHRMMDHGKIMHANHAAQIMHYSFFFNNQSFYSSIMSCNHVQAFTLKILDFQWKCVVINGTMCMGHTADAAAFSNQSNLAEIEPIELSLMINNNLFRFLLICHTS